jgi:hypothetical protein
MAEGIISRKGGSAFTTNALIRQASVAQGNTISPGNIITLNQNNLTYPTYDLPTTTTQANSRKMVRLSDTTAFVLYGTNDYSANTGAVITQNANKTITMGTTSTFNHAGGQGTSYGYDIARLNDGRILYVGIEYNTSIGVWQLYFRFITITGNSVTFSSDVLASANNATERCTTQSALDPVVLEVINDNQVLVHYVNANNYNTARIFTISGTSISGNTPFVLNTTFATQFLSIAKIDENRYVVGYQNQSTSFPYVQILVVSGTSPNYNTVTMGTAYIPVGENFRSTAVAFYSHAGVNRVVFAGWSDNAYRARLFWYDVDGANLNQWTSTTMWGTGSSSQSHYLNGNANINLKLLYADRVFVSGLWRDGSNYRIGAARLYDSNSNSWAVDYFAAPTSSTSNDVRSPYAVYLNQNNIIFGITVYNTQINSTYRNTFYSIYNTDYLVAANTTGFTLIRGFALTGGTQDQLIDVYTTGVSPT